MIHGPDTSTFIALLYALPQHPFGPARTLFTPGEVNSVVARRNFEWALAKEGLELVSLPVNAAAEVMPTSTPRARSRCTRAATNAARSTPARSAVTGQPNA